MIRGGIYALLALAALAFCLAAIGTDIAEFGSTNAAGAGQDNKLSVWHVCGRPSDQSTTSSCVEARDVGCDVFMHRMRTMQAFYVLTAIFLLVALVFAVLDHGNVHGYRHYRPILLTLAFLIVACSVIGWALAIVLVRQSHCGSAISDAPGFEWEASPFLLVVTTFFGILMFIAAHRAPGLATAK
jgi:hypothetical protein